LKLLTCVVSIDLVLEKTTDGDMSLHVSASKAYLTEVNTHRVHFVLK
jgi:hypothetical protein